MHLVGIGRSIVGYGVAVAVDLEASHGSGQLGRDRIAECRDGICACAVHIKPADQAFFAPIGRLCAADFDKRYKARDQQLAVVGTDCQTTRLEVAVGVISVAGAAVHVDRTQHARLDRRSHIGLYDGEGVLHAVGHENTLAIGGDHDVPRFCASDNALDEGRIKCDALSHPNDRHRVIGGVGDIGVVVVGVKCHTLRLVADAHAGDFNIVESADDGHAVVFWVDRPDIFAIL